MKKKTAIKRLNPLFFQGIAHRGYHNEQYTENSSGAFKRAIDNKIAIELDIHLSKDNQLVVCHDSDLKRTTGKEGIIEELTVEEIKANYRLLDGSEVPLLKEVLELVNEQVPLVIELKHYQKNKKTMAKRLKYELRNIKDKNNFMLIAFHPFWLMKVRRLGIFTSLLIHKDDDYTWHFRSLFNSLDVETILLDEKKYLRYQKKHLLNVWTVRDEDTLKKVTPLVDLITFEHIDVILVRQYLKQVII